MTDKTELERLKKNVVETKAAYDAFIKARLELSKYLKEQGND
jgi:hypothetical protein